MKVNTIKPVILKNHKRYFKKPIGKYVSSEIKNRGLTIKCNIDIDFLNSIGVIDYARKRSE